MTDRISSAMIPQSALASISLAQQQLVEAARQSSAQTKATDMMGYGRDAQTLVSAQRLAARTQGFISTSNELKTRMSLQDVALGRAANQIAKLKDDLFQNVGLDSGDGVRAQLEETFSVLKDAMNTNLGGRYLFGGVQNDQPPVTATSLSNLAANPLSSSIVQGAPAQVERVEAGRTVTAGPVADDVITNAMASIQRLTQVDEGVDGPFGGTLTDNQKTAIQNELSALTDAFNGLLGAQAENGRLSKDVDAAATRQQGNLDSLNGAVGGIVNVDLAAVAVKLNQAQFAYQASAGVFATIKGLSLLNYLTPPAA
jgi:flagellar hook-associated protein 3 FlgL